MDGSKLVLDYFPGKSGNGIVSVRATANGLSTYLHQYYYVTDTPPEVAKIIPPLNAKSESAVTNIDLTGLFTDSEGDPVAVTIASISNDTLFNGEIDGNSLKINFNFNPNTFIKNFMDGATTIRATNELGLILLYTLIIWIMYYCSTYFATIATGIELEWFGFGVLLISTTLAISVPAAPGYVGTYHAAAVYILTSYFFIDRVESQAFAVILHAVGFLPLLLIGFIFFIRSSLHFKDVSKEVIQE